jgi:hypothetical protein
MLPRPLQPRLLQSEIPLRRLIRIINQHQPRIEPQPLSLLHHSLLILPNKPSPKKRSNRSYKWHPIKNIPGRTNIDPASRRRHRSHRSQTSKPLAPRANRLIPPVRQHKIDRRCNRLPINPQQLIRRRIRTRSMRRHPKPRIPTLILDILDWLKVLRLLVNTSRRPPPPGLVHKRPMRRIHQPNNPVIHIAGQLRRQMRSPKPPRKLRHLRHRRQLSHHPPSPRLRQINPRIPIPLLTRISPRINLPRLQRLVTSQRRNLQALPRTRLKPPPVVLASHRLSIEPPRRQRNPPMRTKIPHRKQPAILLPSHQQRHPQQQSRSRLPRPQLPRPHSRIPIPKDQLRRRPTHLNKITHIHQPTTNHPKVDQGSHQGTRIKQKPNTDYHRWHRSKANNIINPVNSDKSPSSSVLSLFFPS